jgi:hypothetical protein
MKTIIVFAFLLSLFIFLSTAYQKKTTNIHQSSNVRSLGRKITKLYVGGGMGRKEYGPSDKDKERIDKKIMSDVNKAKLKKTYETPKTESGYRYHLRLVEPIASDKR